MVRLLKPKVKQRVDQPPPVLYHYTSQRGLLGILDSRELWASNTHYTNDQAEYRYALKIIREELEAKQDQPDLTDIAESVGNADRQNVCICSFSSKPDDLSQWRAYGGPSGFAIGFESQWLLGLAEAELGVLVRCLYNAKEQRQLVQQLLSSVSEDPDEPLSLTSQLARYAPMLKDSAFEAEAEWRIVTPPIEATHGNFFVRAGASMPVPSYRIPLGSHLQFRIREIWVGPTPHSRQARIAVQMLLTKYGLAATVRNSRAPYRHW